MNDRNIANLDYHKPIEIAEGIYWVGYADDNVGLHCNPYLIVDGEEAVLIDGGSRNDFSTVMMKILQTGVSPHWIERLIYQHYDPDLCGSVPHFESMIKNENLKILSHEENNIYINYYSSTKPKECIESIGMSYTFRSGRKLEFIRTPYSHSPGSFVTYDTKTKTLFSSDIYGSNNNIWELYLELYDHCLVCPTEEICSVSKKPCPVKDIVNFHQKIMTSKKALNYAIDKIEELDIELIAPQHGSLIHSGSEAKMITKILKDIDLIGIDWYLKESK